MFFSLKLLILINTELIEFSVLDNLHICPMMVLGYFILRFNYSKSFSLPYNYKDAMPLKTYIPIHVRFKINHRIRTCLNSTIFYILAILLYKVVSFLSVA